MLYAVKLARMVGIASPQSNVYVPQDGRELIVPFLFVARHVQVELYVLLQTHALVSLATQEVLLVIPQYVFKLANMEEVVLLQTLVVATLVGSMRIAPHQFVVKPVVMVQTALLLIRALVLPSGVARIVELRFAAKRV